jgi:segregation and condensation protein A
MTISETEALDLAARNQPIPREAAQRVLDYLIFHRSLLDGSEKNPALLERYMVLVKDLKEGVHIVIADPFQKATALLFELVMDEEFDPWEIDLVKFTQAYYERLREEGGINFAVTGRLVYMAWSILNLQSREILAHRENPPELGTADPGALDDGYLGDLSTPEALDVTTAVLDATSPPPLLEMVRHPETRPVSLLELVQAFGAAEREARQSLRVEELRERLREEQRSSPEVLVHGDIPEQDLADAWEGARSHAIGAPFDFTLLWRAAQGRDRLVTLFLAVLFLARERVIDLTQERRGASPLLVTRLAEVRAAATPEE